MVKIIEVEFPSEEAYEEFVDTMSEDWNYQETIEDPINGDKPNPQDKYDFVRSCIFYKIDQMYKSAKKKKLRQSQIETSNLNLK